MTGAGPVCAVNVEPLKKVKRVTTKANLRSPTGPFILELGGHLARDIRGGRIVAGAVSLT